MIFTIYSTPKCSHCVRAKNALQSRKLGLRVIDITQDTEAKEFVLSEGHKTVPQVYVENALGVSTYIGGADELLTFLKTLKG